MPAENFRMLDALFRNGTTSLRRSAPDLLLDLYEEWIEQLAEPIGRRWAFARLSPLIEDQTFENLPPSLPRCSARSCKTPLRRSTPICRRSSKRWPAARPTETAYFLRQTLSMASGPGTARLIRRCLPSFGPSQQASLRAALQAASVG